MTAQPSLFDQAPWDPRRYEPPWVTPPLARVSDPPTSHRAAEAAFPAAKEQGKHIVACLLGMRARGGTAEEIADALNGGDPNGPWNNVIVSRRIAGLRLNHVCTYDGLDLKPEITRTSRRGSEMAVHVAKIHGLPIGRPPELEELRKAG